MAVDNLVHGPPSRLPDGAKRHHPHSLKRVEPDGLEPPERVDVAHWLRRYRQLTRAARRATLHPPEDMSVARGAGPTEGPPRAERRRVGVEPLRRRQPSE